MRKTLKRIAAAEGLISTTTGRRGRGEGKGRARAGASDGDSAAVQEVIERVVLSSKGDIRHAILTLQLQLQGGWSSAAPANTSSSLRKGEGKLTKTTKKATVEEDKDIYLSNFHAIGKILYAKRRSCLIFLVAF